MLDTMSQDGLALEATVNRRQLIPIATQNNLDGLWVVQHGIEVTPLRRINEAVLVNPEGVDVDTALLHCVAHEAVQGSSIDSGRSGMGFCAASRLLPALFELTEYAHEEVGLPRACLARDAE